MKKLNILTQAKPGLDFNLKPEQVKARELFLEETDEEVKHSNTS